MTFADMKFAKRTLGAAAFLLLAAFSVPASAQTQAASGVSPTATGSGSMTGIGIGGGPVVDEATLQKRKEIEEAYKRTTKSQPAAATGVNDPWANMRGPDEHKPAAKTAAKTATQKKKPAQ